MYTVSYVGWFPGLSPGYRFACDIEQCCMALKPQRSLVIAGNQVPLQNLCFVYFLYLTSYALMRLIKRFL